MDNYNIEISSAGEKDLKKLQNKLPDFDDLINIIDDLSIDPRPIGVRKIKGFDRTFRIRFCSYRIIYDIYDFYADVVTLPKLLRWITAKIDKFFMKFASAVIIVDKSILKQIGGYINNYIVIIIRIGFYYIK